MGKHVKMSLLVTALGPSLCLLFVDIEAHVGSLGIADLHAIHPGEGLDDALFSEAPNVSGKSCRLVHQLPAVVKNKIAEKFLAVLSHRSARCRASTTLKKGGVYFRMLVQIPDQAFR